MSLKRSFTQKLLKLKSPSSPDDKSSVPSSPTHTTSTPSITKFSLRSPKIASPTQDYFYSISFEDTTAAAPPPSVPAATPGANSVSLSRAPSLSSGSMDSPRTPIDGDYFSLPVITPSASGLAEFMEGHHRKMPSQASSNYDFDGCATGVLEDDAVTECDEIAMQILEKVSAEDYRNDLANISL